MYFVSVDALVLYDYTATASDELTIKKGDVIHGTLVKEDGWLEGTLAGKRGVFPDNFVSIMDKDAAAVQLRSKKDPQKAVRQCRVVYSYSKDHDDELELNVGDVIEVLGEEEAGWWRGVLHGREGVFPSNFVEDIVESPLLPPKPCKYLYVVFVYSLNE